MQVGQFFDKWAIPVEAFGVHASEVVACGKTPAGFVVLARLYQEGWYSEKSDICYGGIRYQTAFDAIESGIDIKHVPTGTRLKVVNPIQKFKDRPKWVSVVENNEFIEFPVFESELKKIDSKFKIHQNCFNEYEAVLTDGDGTEVVYHPYDEQLYVSGKKYKDISWKDVINLISSEVK